MLLFGEFHRHRAAVLAREFPATRQTTVSAFETLHGEHGAVHAAPPTRNLDNPSVETAIDLVPKKARQRESNTALSNSFGFGGTNAALLFKRYDG